MFADRTAAGESLSDELRERGVESDLVLAIPRGGLPLGRAVADALDAPLDVAVASKVGAPANSELALGAVAEDGSAYWNQNLLLELQVEEEYREREREREAANARDKAERYRGDPPAIEGKNVVLVDDGVATGATMRACLAYVQAADPASIVVAVPVGPPDTLDSLAGEGVDVISLEAPETFRAVGAHYHEFEQVTDEEAMSYLDEERRP